MQRSNRVSRGGTAVGVCVCVFLCFSILFLVCCCLARSVLIPICLFGFKTGLYVSVCFNVKRSFVWLSREGDDAGVSAIWSPSRVPPLSPQPLVGMCHYCRLLLLLQLILLVIMLGALIFHHYLFLIMKRQSDRLCFMDLAVSFFLSF